MKKPVIPTNDCKGCAARDEIIKTLAARIDELEPNDILELPDTCGYPGQTNSNFIWPDEKGN